MRTTERQNRAINRRAFLQTTTATAAGLALASTGFAQQSGDSGVAYSFVNKTNGKFKDEECFWSLNAGREWHSFAKEPKVACPRGNGRVYFCLGTPPKNFADRKAYWDFVEYAANRNVWNGNTTQVDAFCIPITIDMGGKQVGITESRTKLFETFRKEAPKAFKACVMNDHWIVSPNIAGFNAKGPHGDYFDDYVDEIWDMYAKKTETPSGKWIGSVSGGALTFTPVGGGKSLTCSGKPNTQQILLGTGMLGANPRFCGALNRHVAVDPADWNNPATFYKAEPCNWYAKFLHEHSIGNKAYGFCYDDDAGQAAYFSAKGDEVVVSLLWD